MSNNRKLQFLLETKLSTDEKVPRTGRILRNKIFVIGFPPNCTEMDLEKFFSNFGLVRETRIVKDEKGITKGYAFITFVKERSVVHALEYRGPLYFMDRKLSINPAIKKQQQQQQFNSTERCLSSSTSIDTHSDMSNASNHTNNLNSLTYHSFPSMISLPISSQSNGTTFQQYYNSMSQPYFHYPVYYPSGSEPVWHQYFSTTTTTNYPSYTHLPMHNSNNVGNSILSQINNNIYHNSMISFTHLPKIFH
ncbi:hypothetical protein I4U23_021552 [Adineta vaga]|nr:hypothetical protein I4U23_021552 [Adineta vaga]